MVQYGRKENGQSHDGRGTAPERGETWEDLAFGLCRLGGLRREKALFERAQRILEELVNKEPGNPRWEKLRGLVCGCMLRLE